MDLISWLKANKIKQWQFAEMLGVSNITLSYIINKKQSPRLELALKIYFLTNKSIDLISLLSDEQYQEFEKFVFKNKLK